MIYSASLFAPETHHGGLIPICRSLPKNIPEGVEERLIKSHPLRKLLAPSPKLLKDYKRMDRAYQAELTKIKAMGYSQPGSFLSHLEVCGSLHDALTTPEPQMPPDPEQFYINEYRQQLRAVLSQLLAEFGVLAQADQDVTLLCWERAGSFCHRNLVMICVAKWLPYAWGGLDVALEPNSASSAGGRN